MALGDNRIRIGILGASGYTGAELIRILARHPAADIRLLSAERSAGKDVDAVFPHLSGLDLPKLIHIDDADWSTLDLVFCALPHGTTQEVVAALPDHLKIVDLSADFRLHDVAAYETWYGHERGGVLRLIGNASSATNAGNPTDAAEINRRISLRRAEAAAAELRRLGLEEDQIQVSSRGAEAPAYDEASPGGEAGNRRVEIYLEL